MSSPYENSPDVPFVHPPAVPLELSQELFLEVLEHSPEIPYENSSEISCGNPSAVFLSGVLCNNPLEVPCENPQEVLFGNSSGVPYGIFQ